MAPIETPATILTAFAYGETSRIARLVTRDLGVVSVIAKGARRPGSRFGAALARFSEGTATIIPARHGDLHTLTAYDLNAVRAGLAEPLERYAAASLLGELMLSSASMHGADDTYAFFRHALDLLELAPPEAVGVVSLRSVWGLVSRLGLAPRLDRCVRHGVAIDPEQNLLFSVDHGGVLCPECARGAETTRLATPDRRDLALLVAGGDGLPLLDARHQAAHRRLLSRWIRRHLAEGGSLPALAFWTDQPWTRMPA